MRANLLFSLLVAAPLGLVACTHSDDHQATTPRAETASAPVSTPTPARPAAERPHVGAYDAEAADHNHGPVSLTGEQGYLQRTDSSGWSGISAPTAMGGGPRPSDDVALTPDTPASSATKPTPAATTAPTSDALAPTTTPSDSSDLTKSNESTTAPSDGPKENELNPYE